MGVAHLGVALEAAGAQNDAASGANDAPFAAQLHLRADHPALFDDQLLAGNA